MVNGIVPNTTIVDGLIIVVIPLGIKEYLTIGEIVTEIIGGAVIPGIRPTSLTAISINIGGVDIGVMTTGGRVLPADMADAT